MFCIALTSCLVWTLSTVQWSLNTDWNVSVLKSAAIMYCFKEHSYKVCILWECWEDFTRRSPLSLHVLIDSGYVTALCWDQISFRCWFIALPVLLCWCTVRSCRGQFHCMWLHGGLGSLVKAWFWREAWRDGTRTRVLFLCPSFVLVLSCSASFQNPM